MLKKVRKLLSLMLVVSLFAIAAVPVAATENGVDITGGSNLAKSSERAFYSVTYYANNGAGGTYTEAGFVSGIYFMRKPVEIGMSNGDAAFLCWNTKADRSGDYYYPGPMVLSGDLELYAQWDYPTTTYRVTYHANGGSGGPYTENVRPGSYAIAGTAKTGIGNANADFLGWNTKADGSGITYYPGDMDVVHGDLDLYAQWSPALVYYTVTYDDNEERKTYSDSSLPAGSYTVLSAEEAGLDSLWGVELMHWKEEGSREHYYPGQKIQLDRDLELYAVWEYPDGRDYYSVTYHANGGIGGPAIEEDLLGLFYTFLELSETGISNGNADFLGWNTKADGSGITYYPGDKGVVRGQSLDLYAQWGPAPEYYTVTYDDNEERKTYSDSSLPAGSYTVLSAEEAGLDSLWGVELMHWKEEGSREHYYPGQKIQLDRDLELYAVWEYPDGRDYYSVTYHANGGIGGPAIEEDLLGLFYTFLELSETGISNGNADFLGWNTKADGSGITYYPGDKGVVRGQSLDLYAMWMY